MSQALRQTGSVQILSTELEAEWTPKDAPRKRREQQERVAERKQGRADRGRPKKAQETAPSVSDAMPKSAVKIQRLRGLPRFSSSHPYIQPFNRVIYDRFG